MIKVLIAITDAGNAHRIAAEALETSFNSVFPDKFQVKIIDILKDADVEPFNTSDMSYSLVSRNTFLDNINIAFSQVFNSGFGHGFFRDYAVNRLLRPVEEIINKFQPDIVICNHPMAAIPLGELKSRGSNFKYVVVMLDLVTFFRSMADRNADLVFAPTTTVASKLEELGVAKEKVRAPLFPLHPRLKEARTKKQVAKDLDFDDSKPIVLITGGGLGLKTLKDAIIKLANRDDLQLIIVTGKLLYFKKELEERYSERKNIKVFGFVDNMQDYFRAADIVVGKPGATTIMECELFEKKAIFTKRVGHVEVGHDQYVRSNPNFVYIGNNWAQLEDSIDMLLKKELSERRPKRSFDECSKIVKEISSLVDLDL